jgi:hypothetical protein
MLNRNKIFFFILVVFLNLLLCLKSNAHHGGEGISGVGVAGPIITIPAYTLPKGLKYINLLTDYTNYNEFSDNKLMQLDRRGEHIHSAAHLFIPSVGLGYGLTDNLTIGVRVPYIFRFGLRDIHDAKVGKRGNSIGIGDITFFSQYRFLKNEKHHLHAALLTGLKIPSGVRRAKGRDDEIFEADEQPGSGSWDPLVGIAISKKIKGFSLDANGLYKFTTKGAQGSNLGDLVNYNLALSHRFLRDHDLSFSKKNVNSRFTNKLYGDAIFEINGSWSAKPNTFHGFIDQNHGGNLVYLSPGVRLTYDKKWIWYASCGFPTIENLNGRAKAPSFRLVSGITRAF